MSTDRPGAPPPDRRDDDGVVGVHTCSRIGMQANPPGPRLTWGGWRRRG